MLALKFAPTLLPWSQTQSKFLQILGVLRPLLFFAGWYEGERLRDGERGWFPMECAKEITCQATIADRPFLSLQKVLLEITGLDQELGNWSRGPLPGFINKVLLEHSHALLLKLLS